MNLSLWAKPIQNSSISLTNETKQKHYFWECFFYWPNTIQINVKNRNYFELLRLYSYYIIMIAIDAHRLQYNKWWLIAQSIEGNVGLDSSNAQTCTLQNTNYKLQIQSIFINITWIIKFKQQQHYNNNFTQILFYYWLVLCPMFCTVKTNKL